MNGPGLFWQIVPVSGNDNAMIPDWYGVNSLFHIRLAIFMMIFELTHFEIQKTCYRKNRIYAHFRISEWTLKNEEP